MNSAAVFIRREGHIGGTVLQLALRHNHGCHGHQQRAIHGGLFFSLGPFKNQRAASSVMITNNVISNNENDGLVIQATGTTIQNNKIGATVNGGGSLPNGNRGINVTIADNVLIENNVIANNGLPPQVGLGGILLSSGANNAQVRGNTIANNREVGLLISNSSDTLVESNTINNNDRDGVRITGSTSIRNRLSRNSIFDNGGANPLHLGVVAND